MGANSTINGDLNENYYGTSVLNKSSIGTTIIGRTKTYNTYQDMLNDKYPGMYAHVLDASGDPSVGSGFAYYRYTEGVWNKIYEEELMDVSTDGHTHANYEVLNMFGISGRRPTFNGKQLAYRYESNSDDDEIVPDEQVVNCTKQFRYEFIDENTQVDMEEKTYIIRNSKFIGQLPLGTTMHPYVCYRLIVDEAAAEKGGAIVPSLGESINNGNVFYLDNAMDVRIIYDSKNKDWVTIGTLN